MRNIKILAIIIINLSLICGCSFSIKSKNNFETISNHISIEQSTSNALQLTHFEHGQRDRITMPWYNHTLYTNQMFRCLFLANSTFDDVTNDLAESYEISDDALTYKITLKDGIKWSDGEDLTVQDVIFSIKTVLLVQNIDGIYTSAFSKIVGYDEYINDPSKGLEGLFAQENVITINLEYEHPKLLQALAQFVILPKHILQYEEAKTLDTNDYWLDPVVSGAYKVLEILDGEYYKLTLNELYEGQTPKIEEIIVYVTQDYEKYALSGKIDTYTTNIPAEINYFKEIDGMSTTLIDLLYYRYFVVNMEDEYGNKNMAMQDVKVRQAIMHAIDRQTLIQGVYPELTMEANSGVPDSLQDSNGVKFEYNPDYAKKLLAESTYDLSRPLRLSYYYSDKTAIDFVNAVAGYLEEIGFTVEIIFAQNGRTDLFNERNYDIALKGLSVFEISEWYGEYLSTNSSFSSIFGAKGEFDDLVKSYSSSVDKQEKSGTLMQLQQLEQELLYKIPLFTMGQMIFINQNRLYVPSHVTFGNTHYKYDIDFANWEIKN